MENVALLGYFCIFLLAAVISVPLANLLGLGSVLGYLAAGILIGPFGLKLVSEFSRIQSVAELGVVILLFLVGLELSPRRLWEMRRSVFGLGTAQVAFTALVIGISLWLLKVPWQTSLVTGIGLAMSSTAIVLQILEEKNLGKTGVGKSAFSVLLYQDLAVIPALALLPALAIKQTVANHGSADSPNTHGGTWLLGFEPSLRVAIGICCVVAIILAGRTIVRPAFRFIARTKLKELFTALSLLIVLGIAYVMHGIGLSMALGTFLAGVVLAESEYRHELESNLEPFKGLLLGLFFTSVGSSMDFSVMQSSAHTVLVGTGALLTLKILALFICARIFRLGRHDSLLFALLLSQGGEFAFVLFSMALELKIFSEHSFKILNLVVALSMMLTPILLLAFGKIQTKLFLKSGQQKQPPKELEEKQEGEVIIAGFGRFGQIVGRLLHSFGQQATLIDLNPDLLERTKHFGFKVFFGDASELALLESAGLAKAKILVLAFDDRERLTETAKLVKKHHPNIKILCRSFDMIHTYELMDAGADALERETFDAALALGEQAIQLLGHSKAVAFRGARKFKRHDLALVQKLYAIRNSREDYVSAATAAREELVSLFEAELRAGTKTSPDGWERDLRPLLDDKSQQQSRELFTCQFAKAQIHIIAISN